MTLLSSRKKLITFRVTAEEYEALRQICVSKRARSISELTRGAVLQHLAVATPSRTIISGDLISLVSALEQIDGALKELSGHISRVLGPAAEPDDLSSQTSETNIES